MTTTDHTDLWCVGCHATTPHTWAGRAWRCHTCDRFRARERTTP